MYVNTPMGKTLNMTQPPLHELTAVLRAPASALSEHSGQIRRHGVQGVFVGDRRMLSSAVLRLDGAEPTPVASTLRGRHAAAFVGLARDLGDGGPDPTVRITRVRTAHADGVGEEIT